MERAFSQKILISCQVKLVDEVYEFIENDNAYFFFLAKLMATVVVVYGSDMAD